MVGTQAHYGVRFFRAQRLAPEGDWQQLVFSGGLAQNLPALRASIVRQFGAPHRVCVTPEDTLQGLLALAQAIAGLSEGGG